MTVLIDWLSQPVGAVWSLFLASLLLLGMHRTARLGQVSLWATLALFWVLSAAGPANALVQQIETLHTNSAECRSLNDTAPVVVLSGGLDAWTPSTDPYEVLDRDSLLRAALAARIAPARAPVFVIGRGSTHRDITPLISAVLSKGGIDPARLVTESKSDSTAGNARAFAALSPVNRTPRVTLVTSHLHAWRAAATFEKLGYRVCVQATDRLYAPAAGFIQALPYLAGLTKSTLALREVLAIALYRARGDV